jgi:hypothetical protein
MPRSTVTRRRAEATEAVEAEEQQEELATEEKGTRSSRKGTRSSRVAETAKAGAGAGWGAYAKAKEVAKSKGFNSEDQLKVEDDPILIKFMDDGPFESYYQHWVQRGKGKKRSWTCPGEDDCPLCAIGHPVRCLTLFNVLEIDGSKHSRKFWVCGKNAGDQIEDKAKSKRYSPINDDDLYFEVTRKEADFGYKYTLNPVRESELDDEEVATEEELDAFLLSLFESGPSTVDPVDYEGLEECADEVVKKGDK